MTQDMTAFGLTERWAAAAREYPGLVPGRVVAQEKGLYRVVSERGEQAADISGKLRYRVGSAVELPAVGDFVMMDGAPPGMAMIHHVLPRKSVFVRRAAGGLYQEQVVAANIDTVFLCMSLNRDFDLRRLERYLAVCWESGALPVVVLTKADLCGDPAEQLAAVRTAARGAEVRITAAREKDGYEQVLPYLKEGQTVALVGSSGVGKSTLLNALLGEDRLATNGLRNDDRGRHTTTRRALFRLPRGGLVIDTPGMREVGLWDADGGLDKTFDDIEALFGQCRFKNCGHTSEPGCAVLAAVDSGALSPERWRSYQKLRAENAYAGDAAGYLAAKERKRQDIAKTVRAKKADGSIRR
ncbi:MAG: ribosome small subunit-dependent GTPase A [Eubacteriales bacterium]